MKFTNVIGIVAFALFFSSCLNGQNAKNVLSPTEFAQKMDQIENEVLLDVRTAGEFEGGHLMNAQNIDWNGNSFASEVAKLDKKTPIMVYCLSGGRSKSAANYLRDQGFKEVYELSGGIVKWRTQDLPETKAKSEKKEMTMAEYQRITTSDKLVLVDFYAEWCAPCKKMKPYLAEIEKDMADEVTVIRIDADANPTLLTALKVEGLPVLKIYKKGEIVWDNLGFVEKEVVVEKLTSL